MISIFLVALAAAFNAVMDRTEEPVHFNRSVFRKLNQKFWLKSVSWQYARKTFGFKWDAWHMAKSAMIISLVCAMVFYSPVVNWWADVLILGATWNTFFVLFYHKVLYLTPK